MTLLRVAEFDDLWNGEMRGCVVRGQPVLLIRTHDRVYAYADRCAHQGVALSKGSLDGSVLTCSAHQWQYDVCTGHGVNPASARLDPIPVRLENGQVFVDLGGEPR